MVGWLIVQATWSEASCALCAIAAFQIIFDRVGNTDSVIPKP